MGQDKTEVLYTKAVIVSTKKKIFTVKRKYFQILRCIFENISKFFFSKYLACMERKFLA